MIDPQIDQRADIHPSARIAEGVTIGPWTVIGADVEIGEGTEVASHVVIKGPTRIGKNNKIYQFASVGEDPQDKKYNGEKTLLEIGDNNVIREFCTLNRGTAQGGGVTRIGDGNLFMAYVHIAHDCLIGNHTIFANNASLSGHVTVHDFVILGGFAAVHQFCVLGAHSFIAGTSRIVKDVVPFVLVTDEAKPCGLNTEGLKRRGFTEETLTNLKRAYKIIYRRGLTIPQSIDELREMLAACPEIQLMIDLLERSERGISR
jgi:UDP-N-acetylglucosamine acyltransferase